MKIKWIKSSDNWREIANAARTTIGKEAGEGEPSKDWKRKILMAEHSPIRKLKIKWKWTELPYWISVHLVRHKIGIEHFVRSQRTDRTGEDRCKKSQCAKVEHEVEANAQAIINISRKRLCKKSAKETRSVWNLMLGRLFEIEPELYNCCVRECIYRGHCPEFESCGYIEKLNQDRYLTYVDSEYYGS